MWPQCIVSLPVCYNYSKSVEDKDAQLYKAELHNWHSLVSEVNGCMYDTIRDAILTCARKPT